MTAPAFDGYELVTALPQKHGLTALLYRRTRPLDPWAPAPDLPPDEWAAEPLPLEDPLGPDLNTQVAEALARLTPTQLEALGLGHLLTAKDTA